MFLLHYGMSQCPGTRAQSCSDCTVIWGLFLGRAMQPSGLFEPWANPILWIKLGNRYDKFSTFRKWKWAWMSLIGFADLRRLHVINHFQLKPRPAFLATSSEEHEKDERFACICLLHMLYIYIYMFVDDCWCLLPCYMLQESAHDQFAKVDLFSNGWGGSDAGNLWQIYCREALRNMKLWGQWVDVSRYLRKQYTVYIYTPIY